MMKYEDYKALSDTNPCVKLIRALGKIRNNTPALCYGDYRELQLQTTHFAYERTYEGKSVIVTVNNSDNEVNMNLPCGNYKEYIGALSGERAKVTDGCIQVKVPGNYGEIWISDGDSFEKTEIIKIAEPEAVPEKAENRKDADVKAKEEKTVAVPDKPYEEMSVEELQEAILEKMRRNGPVTDYMLGTVRENTHHGSLVIWVRSFN